jgi:ceramide glucosyltransferase
MNLLLTAVAILAVLLFIQSVASLADGFRYLRRARLCRAQPPAGFTPQVALIIPCKGADEGLERNIRSFLAQDYPLYQVIFVVADSDDAAGVTLREIISSLQTSDSREAPSVELVVAGHSETCGEKVHNLLRGLEAVSAASEVLVFADADGQPGSDWLQSLVAPLADPEVTVSTGFRWYLPSETFASQLRAAWDTSIATLLGDHDRNFAWGGSMALRAGDFRRMQIAEKYWQSTVSDDYEVRRALRAAGGKIHFEPRCLVPSQEDSTLGEFMRWANRQIILTRVYAPDLWVLGLASHLLYGVTFFAGLSLLILPGPTRMEKIAIFATLGLILALGVAKAATRTILAKEIFPGARDLLAQYGGRYWQLAPLVPWIMLWNFVWAGFTRRIEWRGVHYQLRPDGTVMSVRRDAK